jgi:hypothetical protein
MKLSSRLNRRRRLALIGAGLAFGLCSYAAIALADNVQNDVVVGGNDTIVAGGSTTINYRITANSGDGQTGCNAADTSPATVTIQAPAGVIATPGSRTFTSCGSTQGVSFSSSTAGNYPITVSVSDSGAGTYNTAPAAFTLHVTAPTNTPPTISVTGVSDGATYDKGSAPAAGCSVSDAEDVGESATPTLSAITGPNSADGLGSQTATCSYTDGGGLNATATVTYSIVDPSGPDISYLLNPASPNGDNGWYVSDVSLDWTVTELESPGSLLLSGCVDQNVTADQAATDYTCSATSAGGSAGPVTVTIKRDATDPTITGSRATPANGYGWNNTDVSVTFSCDDNLSGVASCGPDQAVSTEGSDQSATGTAKDNAGNTAQDTVSGINIDETDPTISGSGAPAANGNGWNNETVTVSFTCNDDRSGVASCETDHLLSSEGANQSATGQVTDKADNTAQTTVSPINIDLTDPTIDGAPTTSPNGNGWFNHDVTVHFTCGDGLSGIASCGPDQTLTSDGADQSVTGTATDNADNTAQKVVSDLDIDKTKPTNAVTGVANGATYTLGSVPAAGCSTTDGLSGPDTQATLSTLGGPVGSVTVTCSGGTDKAGNTADPASVTYNVHYAFAGFFAPIDNPETGKMNGVKAGSSVPVKFSLGGNQGLNIFQLGSPPSWKFLNCANGEDVSLDTPTTTAGSSSLSYDPTSGWYTYVWKTDRTWAGKCLRLTVTLGDGTAHVVDFKAMK